MTSLNEDGMLARTNKIKAMFGVQLKEQATLPGISREKTGKSIGKKSSYLSRDSARCHPTLIHLYLQLLVCRRFFASFSNLKFLNVSYLNVIFNSTKIYGARLWQVKYMIS